MISKKTLVTAGVLIPFLAFVGWAAHYSLLMNNSAVVLLPIRGYDPRNLLSGHYIQYQIDWAKADCSQFPRSECPQAAFRNANRFYVPENKALTLERAINAAENSAEVAYAYQEGKTPVARTILINKRDWKEMVE